MRRARRLVGPPRRGVAGAYLDSWRGQGQPVPRSPAVTAWGTRARLPASSVVFFCSPRAGRADRPHEAAPASSVVRIDVGINPSVNVPELRERSLEPASRITDVPRAVGRSRRPPRGGGTDEPPARHRHLGPRRRHRSGPRSPAASPSPSPARRRGRPVGAGCYTTDPAGREALPSGCGDISTNPAAVRHRQRARRAGPHQRLVVLAAVQEDRLRVQRAAVRPPGGLRHLSPAGSASPTPTTPTITGTATGVGEYNFSYTQDLLVGVAGLTAAGVKVDGWSDWTVSPAWIDGTPHADGDHRPRTAVVLLRRHRRRQRADQHRRPAEGLGEHRRHDRLQRQRS